MSKEEPKGAEALFEERATEVIETAPLDIASLGGDLRDMMLELFKHRPKPWDAMLEDERRGIVRNLKSAVDDALAEVARVIAAEGRDFIMARLDKFTAKGGKYQATLIAQGEADLAMEFARLDGHAVLIISADAEAYQGSRSEPDIPADQPPLEFGEEPLPAHDPATGELAEEK